MARKTTKRPASAARRTEFQPHDFLLAGLGAVSLGRKQVAQFYENGFEGVADGVAELRSRAEDAVQSAAKTVSDKVVALRKQAKAKAAPVKKQVIQFANEAKAQAQTRLAPVLAKFGVKKAPAKRAPARKKAAAKRTRKAA
jgi:hypothetical protein